MSLQPQDHALPDIIYLGMNPWDSIRQRAQHLAAGLSRYGRVLFVDPITPSVLGALRQALQGEPKRPWWPLLEQLDASLHHLLPPPGMPFGLDLLTCNAANQALQAALLRRVARRLGFRRPVLWLDHPLEADQIGRHSERLVIYNCMDNYPAFWSGVPRRRRLAEALEKRVLAQADLVLASSRGLMRRCASAKDVQYIPNACDADLFARARGAPWPEALRGRQRPLLGYVGTVSHWVDLALVAELAAAHPDLDITLVGPIENVDVRPYRDLRNVHFVGPVAYEDVPAYVNAFDVCLIPFKVSQLTADVDPVKVYEYLALGKPVVAVGLPELVRYGELIYLAEYRKDAERALSMALEEVANGASPVLVAARQRVAFENTWDARVDAVARLIQERVGGRDS